MTFTPTPLFYEQHYEQIGSGSMTDRRSDWHDLGNGFAVYKQPSSKNWYLYARLNGQQVRRSLKTSDLDRAKEDAIFYMGANKRGLEDVSAMLSPPKRSVSIACNNALEEIEGKPISARSKNDYCKVIEEVRSLFGKKSFKHFSEKDIHTILSRHKSKTRIATAKAALNILIESAVKNSLIERRDAQKLPSVQPKGQKRRQVLTKDELVLIDESWQDFIDSSRNFKTREKRTVFKAYFNFMLETGTRPGDEMDGIRWGDIKREIDSDGITMFATAIINGGKTKHYNHVMMREIVLTRRAQTALSEIARLHGNYYGSSDLELGEFGLLDDIGLAKAISMKAGNQEAWKKHDHERARLPRYTTRSRKLANKHIFRTPYAPDMKIDPSVLFNQLLDFCDIEKGDRDTYSLRHGYITNKIRDGLALSHIANQCGTSVPIIESHYNKFLVSKNAKDFLKSEK